MPMPTRRHAVKITIYAELPIGAPDPDSIAALLRLLQEHPDHVEIYDVTDTGTGRRDLGDRKG